MTWPTYTNAPSAASVAWGVMTGKLVEMYRDLTQLRTIANAGQLTPARLAGVVAMAAPARAAFAANLGVAGVQAYARLVTGVGTFDLNAEVSALTPRFDALINTARAMFLATREDITAEGVFVPGVKELTAQQAAPLVVAIDAFLAQIRTEAA